MQCQFHARYGTYYVLRTVLDIRRYRDPYMHDVDSYLVHLSWPRALAYSSARPRLED